MGNFHLRHSRLDDLLSYLSLKIPLKSSISYTKNVDADSWSVIFIHKILY